MLPCAKPSLWRTALIISGLACLLAPSELASQTNYQIGSSNTVTADVPLVRPVTAPCKVQLFQNLAFQDFTPKTFQFTPPASCPGPWLKVVFEGDFSVSAGVQFDRTASVWIGGANIYFGTTAEPSPTLSPSWHVESDMTDYTALFLQPQTGMVQIDNLVNSQYNGVISGSADLEFYAYQQTGTHNPKPYDMVLPLSAGPTGGTVTLATPTDTLSRTFTFPMNVQKAVLDVYAQSQNADEFWYTCVPDDVAALLQSCGGTAFRETEITIDGQPAGVAPVFPWIYAGGIDPNLWYPLPGVQTLNFTPYRVDLSPFAGLLSNGQPHTVALSVFNADNYFSTTASLLLLLDQNSSQVTGAITQNTLKAAPTATVLEKLNTAGGGITGGVSVRANHNYSISGYIIDAKGKNTSTVTQTMIFSNVQAFNIDSTQYAQNITQLTQMVSTTTTKNINGTSTNTIQQNYPLTFSYKFAPAVDALLAQTTFIDQAYNTIQIIKLTGQAPFTRVQNNQVAKSDQRLYDLSGNFLRNQGQAGIQHFVQNNSLGLCYDLALSDTNNLLTNINFKCNTVY